jgi:hypothetical protein
VISPGNRISLANAAGPDDRPVCAYRLFDRSAFSNASNVVILSLALRRFTLPISALRRYFLLVKLPFYFAKTRYNIIVKQDKIFFCGIPKVFIAYFVKALRNIAVTGLDFVVFYEL